MSDLEINAANIKVYRDFQNSLDTARIEGEIKGKIEGEIKGKIEGKIEEKIEIAKIMKQDGEPIDKIVKYTGLTVLEIKRL